MNYSFTPKNKLEINPPNVKEFKHCLQGKWRKAANLPRFLGKKKRLA